MMIQLSSRTYMKTLIPEALLHDNMQSMHCRLIATLALMVEPWVYMSCLQAVFASLLRCSLLVQQRPWPHLQVLPQAIPLCDQGTHFAQQRPPASQQFLDLPRCELDAPLRRRHTLTYLMAGMQRNSEMGRPYPGAPPFAARL